MGIFFGKIQNVPKDYLIRTLQSHDRDTVNVLSIPCTGNTARGLVGNILNVLMMDQVGFSQVHCPCPYSVFTMSWVRKLVFVPSVRGLSPSILVGIFPQACHTSMIGHLSVAFRGRHPTSSSIGKNPQLTTSGFSAAEPMSTSWQKYVATDLLQNPN